MSRFCILMYHMVAEPRTVEERRFACPPEQFADHMKALRRNGYSPVSLAQVEDHLAGRVPLPEQAVAVTLDDGFRDNHTQAFPVLRQWDIPATVFLAVDTLGDANRWMAAGGFPTRAMLDWGEIREMQAGGVTFGSHTLSHPRLSTLDRDAAAAEVRGAKAALEEGLGTPVDWFAYPYGDLSEETVEVVREAGHTLACTTRSGFNRPEVDPLQLRRLEVYGTDPTWKVLQKLRFGTNDAGPLEPLQYYWRRALARIKGH